MKTPTKSRRRQRGSALLCSLLFSVTCAALGAAMLKQSFAVRQECDSKWAQAQRLYLAKAGIANSFAGIRAGGSGAIGSVNSPQTWGGGGIAVTSESNADGSLTLTSRGIVGGYPRIVRAVVRDVAVPVFDHAMYAGNSSGDPNYSMTFGGTGTQSDNISGDIYSGRNILAVGTPVFTGTRRAAGTITGTTGTTGMVQPGPDLAAMNYAVNNNVNVSTLFSTVTTKTTNNTYGGKAYQLPSSSPGHIFRKNPDDRASEVNGTVKHDYFLEDPYAVANTSSTIDAAHATPINLNTASGANAGNNVVYYIDGNMWLHNKKNLSFKLMHPDANGVRVTFVIKGNLYLSDNLFLQNAAKDGIAFIALKDAAVADSGNIYFGDPAFGTLEEIDAFMYAENNFYDTNLDATGSKHVVVRGTMSAGNQVAINRDYGSSHTRMDLVFDNRIKTRALVLPGLPKLLGGEGAGGGNAHDFRVASTWGAGY